MPRFIILIFVVLSTAACNPGTQTTTPDTPPISQSPTQNAQLPQTHTDNQLGLSIDYPSGWTVEGNTGSLIQILSPETGSSSAPRSQGGGFPADRTKIEFIVVHSGDAYRTIDEFIDFSLNQQEAGPGGTTELIDRRTVNGIPAARFVSTTQFPILVIEHNGKLIIITGYGDVTRFDEITATLRPA